MKIAVIGGGVSGLSIAQMLKDEHEVIVFEKKSEIGGIARTKSVQGSTYHVTGGHCFNSKFPDVLDFVFSKMPKSEWHEVQRVAKIYYRGQFVSYPIEFSLKELYSVDKDVAKRALTDLVSENQRDGLPNNLEEYFISKFGSTLAQEYFIPYNKKIWGLNPKEMDFKWVKDKIPNPDKGEILDSIFSTKADKMPHSVFFYPNSNNQNDFLRRLAEGVNIEKNNEVVSLEKQSDKWLVNGELQFDRVISTVPLNLLPNLFGSIPERIRLAASKLKYNKVTTMLWESAELENTWTYFPSSETVFHRHIHIGNFFKPRRNLTITESVGEVERDVMVNHGRLFDHLIKPLDYHVSDHAYVVFDQNYHEARSVILSWCKELDLDSLGRFGEWEYYNMDICIKSAMDLADRYKRFK